MGGFYLKLLFHKMLITNYKFKNQFLKIISNLFALMMNAIDLLMRPLQKMIGVRRMPYIFLLPNLIFFFLDYL
jgi:hypothetical protein